MGKALDRYERAVPGKGWTTDKIVKLAKEMQTEGADIGFYMYGLTMLAVQPNQSYEVNALLAAMVEAEAERKNKEVEVDPNAELI